MQALRQPQPQAELFNLPERQMNACIYLLSSYAGFMSRISIVRTSPFFFSFAEIAKGPPVPPFEDAAVTDQTNCACGRYLPHLGCTYKPCFLTYVLEYLLPDVPGCLVIDTAATHAGCA